MSAVSHANLRYNELTPAILPRTILERILEFLPTYDHQRVSRVNRHWRQVVLCYHETEMSKATKPLLEQLKSDLMELFHLDRSITLDFRTLYSVRQQISDQFTTAVFTKDGFCDMGFSSQEITSLFAANSANEIPVFGSNCEKIFNLIHEIYCYGVLKYTKPDLFQIKFRSSFSLLKNIIKEFPPNLRLLIELKIVKNLMSELIFDVVEDYLKIPQENSLERDRLLISFLHSTNFQFRYLSGNLELLYKKIYFPPQEPFTLLNSDSDKKWLTLEPRLNPMWDKSGLLVGSDPQLTPQQRQRYLTLMAQLIAAISQPQLKAFYSYLTSNNSLRVAETVEDQIFQRIALFYYSDPYSIQYANKDEIENSRKRVAGELINLIEKTSDDKLKIYALIHIANCILEQIKPCHEKIYRLLAVRPDSNKIKESIDYLLSNRMLSHKTIRLALQIASLSPETQDDLLFYIAQVIIPISGSIDTSNYIETIKSKISRIDLKLQLDSLIKDQPSLISRL